MGSAPTGRFDAIIVPGARVYDDGRPSPALVRRVALGVRLWMEEHSDLLVMTGRGPGSRSEAVVMAELARESGVRADALLLETEAMNTEQNARFTAAMLDGGRVLVATDSTHVWRCEQVFGEHFAEVVGVGAPQSRRNRVRSAFREALREAWFG